MSPVSRGFRHLHRAPAGQEDRVPPGQYVTDGFPVHGLAVPALAMWKGDAVAACVAAASVVARVPVYRLRRARLRRRDGGGRVRRNVGGCRLRRWPLGGLSPAALASASSPPAAPGGSRSLRFFRGRGTGLRRRLRFRYASNREFVTFRPSTRRAAPGSASST